MDGFMTEPLTCVDILTGLSRHLGKKAYFHGRNVFAYFPQAGFDSPVPMCYELCGQPGR
jgi:hypothetical protein